MKYSPLSRSATFGLITAILPCGFLYAALLLSISYANPIISGSCMLVFSLATAPILIGSKSFILLFSNKFYRAKKIIFSALLISTAIFSLIRGGVFQQNTQNENSVICHPHF